ncbi:MAG: ribosomal-processing cysteine protease Prp [Oscillospiraceae bacterium]|jgi:uncharacterized protein YsxB (DUF464 family)|nr:ribosomal-processing cysteine protease Prp [Oscillospiraceae bacterium]MDD3261494.1 ribosomal-processing cysteine protease Prp [Oscillospiraceae bacterium]
MITCSFLSDSQTGQCVGFELQGHAEDAESGSSIVCAAVSSAAYLVANAVTDVLQVPAEESENDGHLLVRVSAAQQKRCAPFFQALRLHLANLKEQYPQQIHMTNKEV